MSAISWNENLVYSASTASAGDDEFRSFMSTFATGLQPGFAWPGSGGGSAASAGESGWGNLRFARAGTSAVTGGYSDGFLLLNTAHASIHHIGSTWTGPLAHSGMLDRDGGLGTAPFTGYWLVQQSSYTTSGSVLSLSGFTVPITFPQAFVNAPSFVFVGSTSNAQVSLKAGSITSVGFSSYVSQNSPILSLVTLDWRSEGTVLL